MQEETTTGPDSAIPAASSKPYEPPRGLLPQGLPDGLARYAAIRAKMAELCREALPGFGCKVERLQERSDRSNSRTPEEEKWDAEASHWKITYTRTRYVGTPSAVASFSVEYSQGSGHLQYPKRGTPEYNKAVSGLLYNSGGSFEKDLLAAIRAQESPRIYQQKWGKYRYASELWEAALVATEPEPMAVLGSVCSDRTNDATFEQWAAELGYEVDSRKAEATYRICCDQERRAIQFFGRGLLDKLAELAQEL